MKRNTKVKLTKTDIYVLLKGLECVKKTCETESTTELLWCKDYVNDLIRCLGKHLNDFDREGR